MKRVAERSVSIGGAWINPDRHAVLPNRAVHVAFCKKRVAAIKVRLRSRAGTRGRQYEK
jgi:hypothetical protein